MERMVKVDIKELPSGLHEWQTIFGGRQFSGKSRTPLFAACRALQRAGVWPKSQIGLFRSATSDPDLCTTIEVGARLTVMEASKAGAPIFAKWQPFPRVHHE
jgi:hypothetical protein